jgi:hypothetical protein
MQQLMLRLPFTHTVQLVRGWLLTAEQAARHVHVMLLTS